MFTAQILATLASDSKPPVNLDIYNGLTGVNIWFGCKDLSEIGLLCHLDSCTAMNTGNLQVHQWLMTAHPHLVAEYIQYDDSNPF